VKNSCQSRAVTVCAVVLASLLIFGCTSSQPTNSNSNNPTFNASPPFSTKEPDRYGATRVVTVAESATDNSVNKTQTTSVLIVRDGNQRREEYEAGALGRLVFMENRAGRYIILPQAKLYADANEPSSVAQVAELQVEAELASPDLLLHESNFAVQYQKLGTEGIAGRTATKYKVVNSSATGSESFIWVDETLGMPIATQSMSANGNSSTRVSMELQAISTEVDSRTFALPADYRKVGAAQILAMVRGAVSEVDAQKPKK
jgi:outer membrane lipoprotein-sorting protein